MHIALAVRQKEMGTHVTLYYVGSLMLSERRDIWENGTPGHNFHGELQPFFIDFL